jgi:pimeloyl-ACP methyl ester carboxylesterase
MIESVTLDVLEAGTGAPVLLVHGWGGFKEGWGDLPGALADAGYRALAVDLPGFGGSVAPPGYRHTPEANAGALAEFALSTGTVAVVAHSMGTFPALHLARLLPRQLSHLVLLGPAPLAKTGLPRRVAALPLVGPKLASANIRRSNRDRASAFTAFVSAAADPERWRNDPAAVAAANDATDRFISSSPFALGRSVHHALRSRAARLAAGVRQPSLVMVGDRDHVSKPKLARNLSTTLPRGRFVEVPDCGHYPFLESPDLVTSAIVAHLQSGHGPSRMP